MGLIIIICAANHGNFGTAGGKFFRNGPDVEATRAGHGMGKPTAKLIEESVDIYAFLLEHLRP